MTRYQQSEITDADMVVDLASIPLKIELI